MNFTRGFIPAVTRGHAIVKKNYTKLAKIWKLLDMLFAYRIYSINRPWRLLNFWTFRVGAYLRWALIQGWALIKFSPFSASVVYLFATKQ